MIAESHLATAEAAVCGDVAVAGCMFRYRMGGGVGGDGGFFKYVKVEWRALLNYSQRNETECSAEFSGFSCFL